MPRREPPRAVQPLRGGRGLWWSRCGAAVVCGAAAAGRPWSVVQPLRGGCGRPHLAQHADQPNLHGVAGTTPLGLRRRTARDELVDLRLRSPQRLHADTRRVAAPAAVLDQRHAGDLVPRPFEVRPPELDGTPPLRLQHLFCGRGGDPLPHQRAFGLGDGEPHVRPVLLQAPAAAGHASTHMRHTRPIRHIE